MQPAVASTNNNKLQSNGRFRPYLSVTGPTSNCPAARPSIPAVRLS